MLKHKKFNLFFFQSFLPPLFILIINKLILYIIFIFSKHEKGLRYSEYQIRILNIVFFYVFFNILIVRGLAVPVGFNLYAFFKSRITEGSIFLDNFYALESSDFFIILLLQQTAFGFFSSITQFRILFHYYWSPTAFLLYKRKKNADRIFLKDENTIFDIGYIYAINLTILGVIFVYS